MEVFVEDLVSKKKFFPDCANIMLQEQHNKKIRCFFFMSRLILYKDILFVISESGENKNHILVRIFDKKYLMKRS